MKSVCIINVFAKRDTIGMLQESVVEFLDWTIYEDWFPCFFVQVKFDENFKVYDGCNESYWSGSSDGEVECSYDCQRVRCTLGYDDQGSKCGKFLEKSTHTIPSLF